MSSVIDDLDDDILDFYEKHCAEPGGVVVVQVFFEDGSIETGVFSTLVLADRWDPRPGEDGSAMFTPYVIDVPDYGNVPKDKAH